MTHLDLVSLCLAVGWFPAVTLLVRRWRARRHPVTVAYFALVLWAMYSNVEPIFVRAGTEHALVRSGVYIAEAIVLAVFYSCLSISRSWQPPEER